MKTSPELFLRTPRDYSSVVDRLNPEQTKIERHTLPTSTFSGAVCVDSDTLRWTLEAPDEEHIIYKGIAVFLPGFMGIKRSSRLPRHGLAQAGLAAVSIEPVRDSDESLMSSMIDPQGLHIRSITALSRDLRDRRKEIVRNMPALASIDFDRKILIPHSMSGLSAPRFANRQSGSVEAVYGLATVGLGGPSLKDLACDFPRGLAGSIHHEFIPLIQQGGIDINLRNLRTFGHYVLKLRSVFEAISCLRHSAVDDADRLAAKGIPYIYESYENDILVRPRAEVAEFVSRVVMVPNYGHLAPQVKAASVAARVADYARGLPA